MIILNAKTSMGWELIPTTSEKYEKIVLGIEELRNKCVRPVRAISQAKNSPLERPVHDTVSTE